MTEQILARKVSLKAARVVAGMLLLVLFTQIKIPFRPVPVTLQTLAVLLIGAFYEPGEAAATVAGYLLAGCAGLPLFSHGGGWAQLMGPTAGYLISFPLMALLVSHQLTTSQHRSFMFTFSVMIVASLLSLTLGTAWLSVSLGWTRAFAVGFGPFVVGDLLKSAIAATLFWRLQN